MSNEWKSAVWQEKARHKPTRFYIRDEFEEIIKEENIDRRQFHEASKFEYENIIRKFYYAFADHQTYPKIGLDKMHSQFRKELKKSEIVRWKTNWVEYIEMLRHLIPDKETASELYLILSEGWVYEGFASEIISVLSETDAGLSDFFIVSKKFEWTVAHSDDGECMYLISV